MSLQAHRFYEFGDFLVDVREKHLLRGGEIVPLTPKVFDTLCVFLENAGRLIEKEELMQAIWEDRFVEISNLTFNIKELRKALGDDAKESRFIETVPRRGYRFIAEVRGYDGTSPDRGSDDLNGPSARSRRTAYLVTLSCLVLVGLLGIAVIWLSRPGSGVAQRSGFLRQTYGGNIRAAAVSPDGKRLVFAKEDEGGEGLWVKEIDGAGLTRILEPRDIEFVGLSVAPNSDYVYYSVLSDNSAILTLNRVRLSGGDPEELSEIATDASVSFSPDGRRFAFAESMSSLRETYLKVANADGTNPKVLLKTNTDARVIPSFRANPVAWSPDGGSIASIIKEKNDDRVVFRVLVVDSETGREKFLTKSKWDVLESIAWVDADRIAFTASNGNSPFVQIGEIRLSSDAVRRLTTDKNSYEWLSCAGNRLFAVQERPFSSLHIAEIEAETKGPKSRQIYAESSRIETIAWPERGQILFNSWASGNNEVWRISPDGTNRRQLTANSHLTESLAVSPVDKSIAYSTLKDGMTSLSEVDRNGKKPRTLTDGTSDTSPVFSPDGKWVYFQRGTNAATLWRVSADGSGPVEQITGYYSSHPGISPDGKTIAYHFMDYGGSDPRWKLGLIDARSHRLLNKLDFPVPITQRLMVWTPDGKLLTMIFYKGGNAGILLLSPTDGEFSTIDGLAVGEISSFAWSPDGKRFAYSQNVETNDVVSIDADSSQ